MRSTVRAKITDREIMQQALEALKLIDDAMPFPVAKLAMKNLRERLAHCDRCGKKLGGPDDIHTCSPERHKLQADGKPVLQDIEQYLMQMAGICTAAVGYWKEGDGIHPDYDTPALRDVARLYAKYDALYKAQSEQEQQVCCGEYNTCLRACTPRGRHLAQSEQEPVACRVCGDERGSWAWQCNHCGAFDESPQPRKPPAQQEQEPVAWRTFDGEGNYDFRDYDMNENYDKEWAERNPTYAHWVEPLYTNPPQRKPLTNKYRAYKKELKQQFGMPCPDCTIRLPKAQPKILIPNQKCWCGYRDNRPRAAHGTKGEA